MARPICAACISMAIIFRMCRRDLAGIAPEYLNMRKSSIYGGSNEIQRNIIAKAVLGL